MIVPKLSQLRPGVGVNVVLKADQSSSKLTTGQIDNVLTKTDHPRGVKVRLSNGQVGRVQSLSTTAPANDTGTPVQVKRQDFDQSMASKGARGKSQRRRDGRGYQMQDDYRQDEVAADSRSLADYMKVPRKSAPSRASAAKLEENTLQARLESEFPMLDTALVAAIIADHGSAVEARNVLNALS